jgi:Integrase core domain/Integrase zinc binding domain
MKEVHDGHLGMVRMKNVARSFIWWLGIDAEIEATVKQCGECSQNSNMPATTMHQWEHPSGSWQRIHADFLWTVYWTVDAFSKWPEVTVMKSGTTSAETIDALRHMFAIWGLPQQLYTDNGPQFVSREFQQFMTSNGIRHTTSAIFHPISNGQAERFVGIFKRALIRMKSEPCRFVVIENSQISAHIQDVCQFVYGRNSISSDDRTPFQNKT